jgi:23S rRNA pseudouridine1911/1915/1917 synthase
LGPHGIAAVTMSAPSANPSIAVETILEDPDFVAIAKPAGRVSEPGLGHRHDSVMNGAIARWGDRLRSLGESRDHGLLHRLDRDTSGVLLVGLTAAGYDAIRAQFEARSVRKHYLAMVEGRPPRPEGSTERGIDEVRLGDMKVARVNRRGGGRPAVTRWRTIGAGRGRTLLEVEIETGRLHQIRAHLADLGCPVAGDRVYRVDLPPNTGAAARSRDGEALALHAWKIEFTHPRSGKPVRISAPIPESIRSAAADAGLSIPSDGD